MLLASLGTMFAEHVISEVQEQGHTHKPPAHMFLLSGGSIKDFSPTRRSVKQEKVGCRKLLKGRKQQSVLASLNNNHEHLLDLFLDISVHTDSLKVHRIIPLWTAPSPNG